ncbi:Hypothetical protein MexAM1_p3METAp0026 (plasmid) [Methylorubrum extorquens AM1]|uniref:Uncharacterized protein n=1 Tax=Methylorubrum extorquens (strain ATCC 14718 / DSM 1338 / JCM 2805 / NCIMB 9133 / AM1) TaxID=272630 RepID=C5B6W8_METEA|nr:Hypothetical protein MexAM1_p3METAp0026 [Methylorubrum extorquens AM1]
MRRALEILRVESSPHRSQVRQHRPEVHVRVVGGARPVAQVEDETLVFIKALSVSIV